MRQIKGEIQRYAQGVGYSRRREAREIVDTIEESNRRSEDVTLAQVCSANLVVLEVACHTSPAAAGIA
jgi:hypothetical protein